MTGKIKSTEFKKQVFELRGKNIVIDADFPNMPKSELRLHQKSDFSAWALAKGIFYIGSWGVIIYTIVWGMMHPK